MARFFVGQRVRIARCENPIQNLHVGKEGVIVSKCDVYADHWDVSTAMRNAEGAPCSWASEHLEPILPDGHRAGDYTNVRDLMDALSSGVPA